MAKAENTAPDGKMYTMPNISASFPGWEITLGMQEKYSSHRYMEAAGIEKEPETLDEFVDMLEHLRHWIRLLWELMKSGQWYAHMGK